eukprot:4524565-Prymnesium_polylepis.1
MEFWRQRVLKERAALSLEPTKAEYSLRREKELQNLVRLKLRAQEEQRAAARASAERFQRPRPPKPMWQPLPATPVNVGPRPVRPGTAMLRQSSSAAMLRRPDSASHLPSLASSPSVMSIRENTWREREPPAVFNRQVLLNDRSTISATNWSMSSVKPPSVPVHSERFALESSVTTVRGVSKSAW